MGHGQIIKCKHCGATFNRYCGVGLFGQESENADERVDQIETNKPICCPECGERLNNSAKEFEEQIQSIFLWD
jgi:hypothetical protein